MHCARFFLFSLTAALHGEQCGDSFTVLQFFSFFVNTIHLFFYLTKELLCCRNIQVHECSEEHNRNKEEEEKGPKRFLPFLLRRQLLCPSLSLSLSLFPCEKPAQRTQRETTDRSPSSLPFARGGDQEQHRTEYTHTKTRNESGFLTRSLPPLFIFPLFYSILLYFY